MKCQIPDMYPCVSKQSALHILGGFLDQLHQSCKLVVSPCQNPPQNLARTWSTICHPTLFVFICECAAGRQTDGHHLGFGDSFGEERPIELDECNVVVAPVQQLWLVSLVNNDCFCAPGTNNFQLEYTCFRSMLILNLKYRKMLHCSLRA